MTLTLVYGRDVITSIKLHGDWLLTVNEMCWDLIILWEYCIGRVTIVGLWLGGCTILGTRSVAVSSTGPDLVVRIHGKRP